MTLKEFIKKRKHLIWYVSDYDSLDTETIVEAVLNYGNWEDVQTLFRILGIQETARIFREQMSDQNARPRYDDKIQHYFKLYFDKYAS
jgi:hypothetical protein